MDDTGFMVTNDGDERNQRTGRSGRGASGIGRRLGRGGNGGGGGGGGSGRRPQSAPSGIRKSRQHGGLAASISNISGDKDGDLEMGAQDNNGVKKRLYEFLRLFSFSFPFVFISYFYLFSSFLIFICWNWSKWEILIMNPHKHSC